MLVACGQNDDPRWLRLFPIAKMIRRDEFGGDGHHLLNKMVTSSVETAKPQQMMDDLFHFNDGWSSKFVLHLFQNFDDGWCIPMFIPMFLAQETLKHPRLPSFFFTPSESIPKNHPR